MATVVLDAGVIIGWLDARDSHHQAAVAFLEQLGPDRVQLMLPVSAYAECLVAPSAKGAREVGKFDAALRDLGVQIADATPDIARRAAGLRARHPTRLRLPDALVIATALQLGAEMIVTTDAEWPRLTGTRVRVLKP